MDTKGTYHVPVLLKQSIDGLVTDPDGVYADATFGGGGHSREILSRLSTKGLLYGFDQDADAADNVPQDPRFTFVYGNFRYMRNFMRWYGHERLNGILADLGVSWHHFDDSSRGFSFRFDGPADMRMNQKEGLRAADVLNDYTEENLSRLFQLYGELYNGRQIARAVVRYRANRRIETVTELVEAVRPEIGREREKKELAKVFQAIRMEVNHEVDALKEMLCSAVELLDKGGRLVGNSFDERDELVRKDYKELDKTENRFWETKRNIYLGFGVFSIVCFAIAYTLFVGSGSVWPLIIGVFFLSIVWTLVMINVSLAEKKALKNKVQEIGLDRDANSVLIENMNKFRAAYSEAYSEFIKIKPDAKAYAKPVTEDDSPKSDPFIDIGKTVTCAKCGGQLKLDKEKKLYECSFCGIAYGASLFFNEPLKKAQKAMKDCDFPEADKRFSYMLMIDPSDSDALLGRILCAGEWLDVSEIALKNEGIEQKMANDIKERAKESIQHSSDEYKSYFENIQKLTDIYCEHELLAPVIKNYSDKLKNYNNRPVTDAEPGANKASDDEETAIVLKRREAIVHRNKLKFEFDELKEKIDRECVNRKTEE